MRNTLELIKDKEEGWDLTGGTHLKDYLTGVTYAQLVKTFGQPLYSPEDSGDGKVQFEWVFLHNNEVFTLYDWKTYDMEYTINELTRWNVGGKTYSGYFVEDIMNMINETVNA
jgi:hypothetical protein